MKLNLFKIDSDVENYEIEELLEDKGYTKYGEQEYKKSKYTFYANEHERTSIPWLNTFKNIFDLDEDLDDYGSIYNGILLIVLDDINYGVSFGHSFHLLQEICDRNFALDFAERQLTNANIDMKSSSYIQNVKIRGLINLRSDSYIMNEGGESYNFVSGKPINQDAFGRVIECSYSIRCSKKLILRKDEDLKEIGKLISKIEKSIERNNQVNSFPRVRYLSKKDDTNSELNKKLIVDLQGSKSSIDVNLSAFDISGNNIILHGLGYKYTFYIKHSKGETKRTFDEITTEYIVNYLTDFEQQIKNFEDVVLLIECENQDDIQKTVKSVIFAEVEYKGFKYILDNGRWGEYNEKFVDELNEQLDYINEKHVILSDDILDIKYKNEDDYIDKIVKNKDYIKLHRKLININGTYSEIADLFKLSSEELIAVKLGEDNKDLIYSFDQAINSIQAIRNYKEYDLFEKLKSKEIKSKNAKKILNSKINSVCLCLEQKTYKKSIEKNEFELKELKSLLLKLKIVAWAKYALDSNIEFNLYINGGKKI